MNRKTFSVSFVVAFLLIVAGLVYFVSERQFEGLMDLPSTVRAAFTQKAILFGDVSEDAVAPKNIVATVSINGKKSRTAKDGEYEIPQVKPGKHVLRVKARDHELFEKEIEVFKGRNRASVRLSLTPEETVARWFMAYKLGRYEQAYEYVHPEDQEAVTKDEYKGFFEDLMERRGLDVVDYSVGESRSREEWINVDSGRLYRDIVEVDTTMVFLSEENAEKRRFEEKLTIHMAKVDRQWKGFWSMPQELSN